MENPYVSMSIASFGPSTLDGAKVVIPMYKKRHITDISDIEGSHAENHLEKFTHKYDTHPEGKPYQSHQKSHTHERNVRNNLLYVDDIVGTRGRVPSKMELSNRHFDPLNPQYQLPSFNVMPPAETKYLRNELFTGDIDGSSSRSLYKSYSRDVIGVQDIDGTQSGWKSKTL